MPTLLAENTVQLQFSDLLTRVPIRRPSLPPARAVGAHQSEILAYIARKVGWLKPGEKEEEEYPLLWALGCAWEEWAASLYAGMEWQPGEVTVDGISGNADGLSDDPVYGAVVEEFKLTYKSAVSGAEFLTDKRYRMWQHQGRAYLKGYLGADQEGGSGSGSGEGSGGGGVVRWHVCHVRNDYHEFGPVYKQYVVWFSAKEVRETWAMLTRFREEAMAEKEGMEVIEF